MSESKSTFIEFNDHERIGIGITCRKVGVYLIRLGDRFYPEKKTVGLLLGNGEENMADIAKSWLGAKEAYEKAIAKLKEDYSKALDENKELNDKITQFTSAVSQLTNDVAKLNEIVPDEEDKKALIDMQSITTESILGSVTEETK